MRWRWTLPIRRLLMPAKWDLRPPTPAGSARRARSRSAVDSSRHHARGPRQGLVPASELLESRGRRGDRPTPYLHRLHTKPFTNPEFDVFGRPLLPILREDDATSRLLSDALCRPAGDPARSRSGVRDRRHFDEGTKRTAKTTSVNGSGDFSSATQAERRDPQVARRGKLYFAKTSLPAKPTRPVSLQTLAFRWSPERVSKTR